LSTPSDIFEAKEEVHKCGEGRHEGGWYDGGGTRG